MLHLTEGQIRNLVGPDQALEAMLGAFAALARGEVHQPFPIGLDLTDRRGEVHLKGAYVEGDPYFAFKVATGFYDNPSKGLPTGSGLVLAFDAWTGLPAALLQDNGYLTELRTAGAGALSVDLLARRDARSVGFVGAGVQARFQLDAIARVRDLERVAVWSRSPERVAGFIEEMRERVPAEYVTAASPDEAVASSDIAVTVTPSREPLVSADSLHPGLHLTCVGSDQPGKQELDVGVFRQVDRIFVDHLEQCAAQGELQHAIARGVLSRDDVATTLGHVAAVLKPGRTDPEEVTLCDLTGVGVQDAAIASLTVSRALETGTGRTL